MPFIVFELLLAGLVAAFLWTQVVVPLWNQTPLFPLTSFRSLSRHYDEVKTDKIKRQYQVEINSIEDEDKE